MAGSRSCSPYVYRVMAGVPEAIKGNRVPSLRAWVKGVTQCVAEHVEDERHAHDDGARCNCSTSSEAYCLVDSGFGYALIPSIYTMPDPFHKVLAWRGHSKATYGFYHRVGVRAGIVPLFAQVVGEVYAHPAFARPLPETWMP